MGVIITVALLALGTQAGSVAVETGQAGVVPSSRAVEPAAVAAPATTPSTTPSTAAVAEGGRTAASRPAAAAPASSAASTNPPAFVTRPQTASAGLAGVVRDRTEAVIPGVQVALSKSASEPAVVTATTNARGEFVLNGVAAGTYVVTITQPGFRTGRTSIDLAAGKVRKIDVVLNVGSLSEYVSVESPASERRPQTNSAAAPQSKPQTVGTLFDDAKLLYEQGLYAAAARTTERALEMLRATSQEASTITDAAPSAAEGAGPIRVGGSIREPKKIRHVTPKYPAEALAAGVEGLVVVEAVIATDGSVKDVQVLRSVPLLDGAAMDAVRQWSFTPTLLNGVPVEVIITASVNFAIR